MAPPILPDPKSATVYISLSFYHNAEVVEYFRNLKFGYELLMTLIIDTDDVLERFDSDKELIEAVFQEFIRTFHERIEKIQITVENNNMVQMSKELHALKGALSNLGAKKAREIVLTLEKLTKDNLSTDILYHYQCLVTEIEIFISHFSEWNKTLK